MNPHPHELPLKQWLAEVRRIGRLLGWSEKSLDTIDVKAWESYYRDGYSPAEAWREEYEAAQ